MQKWKIISANGGYKIKAAGGDVDYYLSCNSANNAQVSATAGIVNFENVGTTVNLVKIYMVKGTVKYYLTASSNEGNGSSGSSSSSVGNVFWTSSDCGERQNWAYHEPKTSTTGAAIVPYIGNYISQQTYELNSNYLKGMSLYDWQQHACGVIATMYGMRAIDKDTSYQPEKVYDKGFVSKGTTEMSWNGTTDYGFRLTKTAGSWNTLKSTVFDEIIAGRPVIIYLKGTGTHFVTAYKLAAGTTRSGISPENVYVMDSWTSGNQTLYDVMHYGSYWTNVSNIRTFV